MAATPILANWPDQHAALLIYMLEREHGQPATTGLGISTDSTIWRAGRVTSFDDQNVFVVSLSAYKIITNIDRISLDTVTLRSHSLNSIHMMYRINCTVHCSCTRTSSTLLLHTFMHCTLSDWAESSVTVSYVTIVNILYCVESSCNVVTKSHSQGHSLTQRESDHVTLSVSIHSIHTC